MGYPSRSLGAAEAAGQQAGALRSGGELWRVAVPEEAAAPEL